jgi:hypothetical protein
MTQTPSDPINEVERAVNEVVSTTSKDPDLNDIKGATSTQVEP